MAKPKMDPEEKKRIDYWAEKIHECNDTIGEIRVCLDALFENEVRPLKRQIQSSSADLYDSSIAHGSGGW